MADNCQASSKPDPGPSSTWCNARFTSNDYQQTTVVPIITSFNYTVCSRCLVTSAYADWKAMYQPSPEQAEKDRMAAYEAGVPHGESNKLISRLAMIVKQGLLHVQCIAVPSPLRVNVIAFIAFQLTLVDAAGYVPPGNKYKDLPTIHLQVVSDLVSLRLAPNQVLCLPCICAVRTSLNISNGQHS